MRALFIGAVLCSGLLAARPSIADGGADGGAAAANNNDEADPDLEVAHRHFDRGREFYDQQKYQSAIAEFEAALQAKPLPDLDYNIARCYDRLGDWSHALDYYRRYLVAAHDTAVSDDVHQRVAALEERIKQEALTVAASTFPPPRPGLRIAAIAVGVATLAAFAVGGGLYGWAAADLPSRRSYCASLPRDCVPSEWADLQARANGAYALFAIGGALAAADVALWTLDSVRRRARRQAWVAPAGIGLAAGGKF